MWSGPEKSDRRSAVAVVPTTNVMGNTLIKRLVVTIMVTAVTEEEADDGLEERYCHFWLLLNQPT